MQTQTNNHYILRLTPSAEPLQHSDPYLDIVWTPLIGPCATALLRTLIHVAQRNPETPEINTNTLAALIGVSPKRMHKALTRLNNHHLITQTNTTITIPNAIALAPTHRINTLPKLAQQYATNRHATTTRQRASQ